MPGDERYREHGRARNEVVEFRGKYVIHRYCYPDTDLCDYHVQGPNLKHALFDVERTREPEILADLRAMIERASMEGK